MKSSAVVGMLMVARFFLSRRCSRATITSSSEEVESISSMGAGVGACFCTSSYAFGASRNGRRRIYAVEKISSVVFEVLAVEVDG